MKVTLINHSDTLGGASVVTFRLMQALRTEGVDAQMLVLSKTSDNESVTQLCSRRRRNVAFFSERINIFLCNGFSKPNLFKISTASHGVSVVEHPLVADADVIVINWINQGMMSLDEIERVALLGKPVVWIMHDMWCLTGVCHHALECENYKEQCGNCQFICGGRRKNDLSYSTWLRKKEIYNNSNIHFVAVSQWLADKARESSLMCDANISVIHHAFPVEFFKTTVSSEIPSQLLSLPCDCKLIVMGAARLDDPIKGFDYAIGAVNILAEKYGEMAAKCQLVLFGDIRDVSLLDKIKLPYHHIGRINDNKTLRNLYAMSSVVLSTSNYETLGATLIEGQAAGCVPVAFAHDGRGDIIDHKINGYIAEYKSPQSIAEGIVWAIETAPNREMLHNSVREKFASDVIAKKYINLFNQLIASKKEVL